MEKEAELEEEEEGAFLMPTCVSLAGSAGGSAVPAAAGHGAQLPQQQRGQAASGAGEPQVSPVTPSQTPVTSVAGALQELNPLETSRSFLGGFFGCGNGWGGEVTVCHHFLGQCFGDKVSQGWSFPGLVL